MHANHYGSQFETRSRITRQFHNITPGKEH